MSKLSENYSINRDITKSDFIRYSPSEISTINTPNLQVSINIPREDSVISLLNSYLELNFDVLHAATNNRYVDGNDRKLVILGTIALFSNYKLTTGSGKHLENIDHAHVVCLMYKLLTSSRGSDDLSIGFDRDRNKRQRELTNNKSQKTNYHVRLYLKDIFGFADYQEKATYGLGHKLILTTNSDNAALNKGNATNNGKIEIKAMEWYVPHYSPSMQQQSTLSEQISNKTPTEIGYPERSVFMKEVNTQNFWTFDLGTQEGVNIPTLFFVIFQQNDRQHDQNFNNDTFVRLPVLSAQIIIGTERYPDSGTSINYDDDDYSQGYGQIKEAFKDLKEDDILQPYITEDDFKSSNEGNNNGYNIYAFDIRYQKIFENAQPVKIEFKFSENIPGGIYGYALVLTKNISKYNQSWTTNVRFELSNENCVHTI